MEVVGQLKLKYDTQKVSDKFQKRDFVLATDLTTPYPQYVSFQVTQDKCTILDSFNQGDEIRVQFNLRGREWNGPQGIKYFNTLEAWRIERAAGGSSQQQQQSSQPQDHGNQHNQAPVFNSSISDNDLPF
jgi:single-strand DNA-binding protein